MPSKRKAPAGDLQFIFRKTFAEIYARGRVSLPDFARDFLDFECHPGEMQWTTGGHPDVREKMLSCSNRWGKTNVAAIELLWRAFYQLRPSQYDYKYGRPQKYVAINIAMSLDQANLAWLYAYRAAMESPKFKQFLRDEKTTNSPFPKMVIGTPDGKIESEIWGRSTAKKARYLLGKSFNFINYDEAAFDADGESIREGVLLMRLADQAGKINYTSSPNGKNWFYRQCMRAHELKASVHPDVLRQIEEIKAQLPGDASTDLLIPWTSRDGEYFWMSGNVFQNPHVSHDHIRRVAVTMNDAERLQNVWGQFADVNTLFTIEDLSHCYQDCEWKLPVPVNHTVHYEELDLIGKDEGVVRQQTFKKSESPRKYVVAADLARKQDKTVICAFDVTELYKDEDEGLRGEAFLVFYRELSRTDWRVQREEIARVSRQYNAAPVFIDSSGLGDVVFQDFEHEFPDVDVTGITITGANKESLIIGLQTAIQQRHFRFPYIKSLVDSLVYYDWNDKKLFTDPVFALALAYQCCKDKVIHFRSGLIWTPDVGAYSFPLDGSFDFDDDDEDGERDFHHWARKDSRLTHDPLEVLGQRYLSL